MGRLLAIDYGTKRCGIAVTDPMQIIASGLTTVSTEDLVSFLTGYFTEEQVDLVVIGEPTRHDGTPSDVEANIKEFISEFNEAFPTMELKRQDERFTSKMAFQTMIDGGMKKKQRRDKAMIDQISATIILQDFLQNYSS
ncbi:MAG: Holliday junction resolvase RuvX [Gilvibacter sp.]